MLCVVCSVARVVVVVLCCALLVAVVLFLFFVLSLKKQHCVYIQNDPVCFQQVSRVSRHNARVSRDTRSFCDGTHGRVLTRERRGKCHSVFLSLFLYDPLFSHVSLSLLTCLSANLSRCLCPSLFLSLSVSCRLSVFVLNDKDNDNEHSPSWLSLLHTALTCPKCHSCASLVPLGMKWFCNCAGDGEVFKRSVMCLYCVCLCVLVFDVVCCRCRRRVVGGVSVGVDALAVVLCAKTKCHVFAGT